ncbi:hypothetical protein L1887_38331 [Cichorium endivia]|nr:hypothetical protein L1887_38331 [Cichorium endivia]
MGLAFGEKQTDEQSLTKGKSIVNGGISVISSIDGFSNPLDPSPLLFLLFCGGTKSDIGLGRGVVLEGDDGERRKKGEEEGRGRYWGDGLKQKEDKDYCSCNH